LTRPSDAVGFDPTEEHIARTALLFVTCAAMSAMPSSPSRAALHAFTVTGHVTESLLPNVSDGDPVAIRYVADSEDLLPNDPTSGFYRVADLSMEFPEETFLGLSDPSPRVTLQYDVVTLGAKVTAGGQLFNDAGFQIAFPGGTFLSDALPLSLSLDQAGWSFFGIAPIHNFLLYGDVESYASVPIPEPHVDVLLLLVISRTALRRSKGTGGGKDGQRKGIS
jgi:hypothetical protein